MSPENLHKILEPYLAATALLAAILGIAALLLKRHGDRARDRDRAEKRAEDRRPGLF